jgi:predicted metal-binding transcription factor (methanogenesis marker protein 9)
VCAVDNVEPEAQPRPFLETVLTVFADIGHGRLWCTCGYLIWTCKAHKDCPMPMGMIETDHTLCKKKTK